MPLSLKTSTVSNTLLVHTSLAENLYFFRILSLKASTCSHPDRSRPLLLNARISLQSSTFSCCCRSTPPLCHTSSTQNPCFFIPLSFKTYIFHTPLSSKPLFFLTSLAQNLYLFIPHSILTPAFSYLSLSSKAPKLSKVLHLLVKIDTW